jgi:glycosyltransferase involved in cell wall biosynthesis
MKIEGKANNKLIALVSNSTWSVYNFRLDIIRYLRSQNYRVLVIAPQDEFATLLQAEGCQYIPVFFNNRSENPLRDLGLYHRLKKIYSDQDPDLIFHYVIKPNIYGSLAAAACSIQSVAVVTGLGYSFARKNWLYRVVRFLYKKSLKKAGEVWFLNQEDAEIFAREKIISNMKIRLLPGEGVNTDHFSRSGQKDSLEGRPFTFLMSARLLKSKGIGIYAAAARILKKSHEGVRFELIGFFEDRHPDAIAREDLSAWEKEGLIRYLGFVRDVRPQLEMADCFVFPSFYHEGVPRCLMEAASMQLPIITSNNRGCKEVVRDQSNGFLCGLNDPADLAEKMERMIRLSPGERSRMGSSGRSLVMKEFHISKVIEAYRQTLMKMEGSEMQTGEPGFQEFQNP